MNEQQDQHRRGVLAALAAFSFWGLAPIYFKSMIAVPAVEIIVHRLLWSIPVLAGFLLLRDGPGFWRRMVLPRKTIATLFVSACLVVSNWLLFVWAINDGQILATSLGYFINPLLNVLLGFLFLHERLSRVQTIAVALAAAGTIYLAWFMGVPPWISLVLALTFGLYGLVRKKLGVGPMIGLLWETLLLAAPAVGYLLWAMNHDGIAFAHISRHLDMLLALAGIITVLPLVWFNMAARSMPLSMVGFFQYLSPTTTFLLAVFMYDEPFTQGYAVAFTCIWLALALVSGESVVRASRFRSR